MSVLDQIAGIFYLPAVFWGVPLVFALMHEAYREWRIRGGGRR